MTQSFKYFDRRDLCEGASTVRILASREECKGIAKQVICNIWVNNDDNIRRGFNRYKLTETTIGTYNYAYII